MNYQQTPIEELDTDVLLELILRGYDAGHMEKLPEIHRLARKIGRVVQSPVSTTGIAC